MMMMMTMLNIGEIRLS